MVRPPRERRAQQRRLLPDRRLRFVQLSDRRMRSIPCDLQRRTGADRRNRLERRAFQDRRRRLDRHTPVPRSV